MPSATSSSAWISSIVRMFASEGVEAEELFLLAGLDMARLQRPHERFKAREVNRLWRVAVHRTGNVNLGLDRALARRYLKFDMASQSMYSGATLVDALEGFAKYLALVNDSGAFTVKRGRTNCWIELNNSGNPRTPRQRIEFGVLVLLLLTQKVAHHPIRPVAVEFTFTEPEDFHPYRMAFQGPLRFGQPLSRICILTEDMMRPVEQHSESLFALHDKVIEARLERMADARTSYRASEELIRRLHLGVPKPAEVARSVGLAERELEKALRAEGQSFAQLLDDVRKELAETYLAVSALPLTQMARLLGWDTPAEFSAASKRWFGMSPAQYRHKAVSSV